MSSKLKKIAVLTSVRNDRMFTKRWIEYYSREFGANSLYMVIDGFDQERPDPATGINVISVPFKARKVVEGDRSRAARTTQIAWGLYENYDIVIAVDIDEFVVLDPKLGLSVAEYLSQKNNMSSLSGLGLDVVQKPSLEAPISPNVPLLSQRNFAIISDRYTKPAVTFKKLRWGSGQHRIKGRNFRIDPNLFIFHFGNVDQDLSAARLDDPDRQKMGWTKHQEKREKLYCQVEEAHPKEGDKTFPWARRHMSLFRPWYAWNKPGQLRKDNVVTIPDRFKNIV